MGLTKVKDSWGRLVYEVRSRNYRRLRELQFEHALKGRQTNFTLWNGCEGIWLLTVKP